MVVELPPQEIHIYSISLNPPQEEIDKKFPLLSHDEIKRFERFMFDHLKRRFLIRQVTLRAILGSYLGIHPTEIQFGFAEYGKPYLLSSETQKAPITFNVSDSDDLSVMAFSQSLELGIDVEKIRPLSDMKRLAKRSFSAEEFKTLLSIPEDRRLETFFNGWTAKEAFIKALGTGLRTDLRTFTVEIRIAEKPRLISVTWDPEEASQWNFYRFIPQEDFIATLAYPAGDAQIKFMTHM